MHLNNRKKIRFLAEAEMIYKAALAEVDPGHLIRSSVIRKNSQLIIQGQTFNLKSFSNVYVAGLGKAAPFMAKGLLSVVGDYLKGGIVLHLPQEKIFLEGIQSLPAPHPLPDQRSVVAARRILSLAETLSQDDLLIVLISGGGSAQASLPAAGLPLQEKKIIIDGLLKAGANIRELNIVRKHLSRIKGGCLAQAAYPASVISLIISDVIHNDLESIASGPTYWDSSTYEDAYQVLRKYNLWSSAPLSVKKIIKKGIERKLKETLKENDSIFQKVHNFIIGDNSKALGAAKEKAEQLSFQTSILTSFDQGEAKQMAKYYASFLFNLASSPNTSLKPICFLAGGELTVTVRGKGKGGRNQEFVLAFLLEASQRWSGEVDWLVMSLGTDGIDGPTEAAGAWASPSTLNQMGRLGIPAEIYLKNNDSYHFFKNVGGLIVTGPTHTNVMDIRLFMIDTTRKHSQNGDECDSS